MQNKVLKHFPPPHPVVRFFHIWNGETSPSLQVIFVRLDSFLKCFNGRLVGTAAKWSYPTLPTTPVACPAYLSLAREKSKKRSLVLPHLPAPEEGTAFLVFFLLLLLLFSWNLFTSHIHLLSYTGLFGYRHFLEQSSFGISDSHTCRGHRQQCM